MKRSLAKFKTIFISLSSLFLLATPAKAQLIPDNTLGVENSRVVRVLTNRDDIIGGATRGTNLFHSFREFNVANGREVYFSNPSNVRNILTRVTGGNISKIFGTLGVDGGANLYLINPNGIFFGDGAKLDIRGSFVGTTADGIKLGNNDVFSATNPANSNLLSVQPEALFTNGIRNTPRVIINQSKLTIESGQSITLSADAISNSGAIEAFGGNIFLEAINGDINTGNINVSLLDNAENAIGNGGDISLVANRNIFVNDGADILANGILGGNINIESQGNIFAKNASIQSISKGNVPKKGKGINVRAKSVELNNSRLESLAIIGTANAGDLTINTDSLRLVNGAQISTTSNAEGKGGNLTVTAANIELIGINPNDGSPSALFSEALGRGDAGELTINTDSLRLEKGAIISTSTGAGGNGGNLTVTAANIELIDISNNKFPSALYSEALAGGNAGEVKLTTTGTLRLEKGAIISTSTGKNGSGKGGNLKITAANIELIGTHPNGNRSAIYSEALGEGNAGELRLTTTGTLRLEGGAIISTSTGARRRGGDLIINAANIELIGTNAEGGLSSLGSAAIDTFSNDADGIGGNIDITTKSLVISDGATINSSNFPLGTSAKPGLGPTGNITITAEEIFLNRGRIIASGNVKGGGRITINTSNFILFKNGSEINTDVGKTIDFFGGNIKINTPFIFAFPIKDQITARAETTKGGNIEITTNAIFGSPQFLTIDASSQLGIDGTVTIDGGSEDLSRSAIALPESPIDAEAIMANDPCEYKYDAIARGSSFTIIGKGGLPSNPRESLDNHQRVLEWSHRPDREVRSKTSVVRNNKNKLVQQNNINDINNKSNKVVQQAVGWWRKNDGTIVLTANPDEVRPLSLPVVHPSCQQ